MTLKTFITEVLPDRALSPSEYTQRMRSHFIATESVDWLGSGLEGFAHAENNDEAEYPPVLWPEVHRHRPPSDPDL